MFFLFYDVDWCWCLFTTSVQWWNVPTSQEHMFLRDSCKGNVPQSATFSRKRSSSGYPPIKHYDHCVQWIKWNGALLNLSVLATERDRYPKATMATCSTSSIGPAKPWSRTRQNYRRPRFLGLPKKEGFLDSKCLRLRELFKNMYSNTLVHVGWVEL